MRHSRPIKGQKMMMKKKKKKKKRKESRLNAENLRSDHVQRVPHALR
jgi:hypothetical protein